MSRSFIHQVHIADGFADDCEELIHSCLKMDTVTYETFCEIWKDMKFGFLYHGRTSGAEIIELSEELIQIAKHYMVVNTSNFEESVAGLFLVYALVNLQPYKRFAALRIIPEDVPIIQRIETVARRQKRYDVLYILGSLLTAGPVQYHAAARERGMESTIRKYLEGYTGIDRLGVRPRGVFHRQNEELDLLRELSSITRRYAHAKEAVGGANNRNLNYTSATFPSELDASLKKVINGIVDKNDDPDENISSMQSVRDKAMKQSVEGLRHLRSATTKTKSPEKPSSRVECEIKQKPGKIKQLSPKKPVTSLAKRKSNGVLPKRKRRRKTCKSDSSTTSEESVLSEIHSSSDKEQDLNLESFSKENNTENEVIQNVLNITIDSLPVFIREEQDGKMIEIEIIDNLKTSVIDEHVENAKNTKNFEEKIFKKSESGEGSSSLAKRSLQLTKEKGTAEKGQEDTAKKIETVKDTAKNEEKVKDTAEREENVKDMSKKEEKVKYTAKEEKVKDTAKKDEKVKDRAKKGEKAKNTAKKEEKAKDTAKKEEKVSTVKLKRPDKRDLKKTLLKSKFKRMGMLNVANFKEADKTKGDNSQKKKKISSS